MVDECSTIDSSGIGLTKHDIHTLGFKGGNELVAVVSGSQYGKYGAFGTLCEFLVLDELLGLSKLILHSVIAYGLAEQRGLKRIADLVTGIVRC